MDFFTFHEMVRLLDSKSEAVTIVTHQRISQSHQLTCIRRSVKLSSITCHCCIKDNFTATVFITERLAMKAAPCHRSRIVVMFTTLL